MAAKAAGGSRRAPACLDVEITPPWPYRLPAGGGGDAVMRVRGGIVTRLLHVEGRPAVVGAPPPRAGTLEMGGEGDSEEDRERGVERMGVALLGEDAQLVFGARVAERGPQEEPVELGLG